MTEREVTLAPWAYDAESERLYLKGRDPSEFIGRVEPASGPLAALAPEMAEAILLSDDHFSNPCPCDGACVQFQVLESLAEKLRAIGGNHA